jgi:hypothetical protein
MGSVSVARVLVKILLTAMCNLWQSQAVPATIAAGLRTARPDGLEREVQNGAFGLVFERLLPDHVAVLVELLGDASRQRANRAPASLSHRSATKGCTM